MAVHHLDRIAAVAKRLHGRAEVLGIEIASTSREYADFASVEATGGGRKITLFPGRSYDDLSRWQRFRALLPVLITCRMICIGVPYSQIETLLLAWLLRICGKKVILLCDSKFDDRPRFASFELLKRLGLACFNGAIFASSRSRDYLHFLGFDRRPLLPGCDGVDLERLRMQAAQAQGADIGFADRDFVFVGRFVHEKGLPTIIAAYARYAETQGQSARRLLLVGTGPLEAQLRQQVSDLGLEHKVVFEGFRTGTDLAGRLVGALGLVLASHSETWGLVVNEAAALAVPVIVSEAPGARDLLVRNLESGYVVRTGSVECLAVAMAELGMDPVRWEAMREASLARSWLGDVSFFADSIELLFDSSAVTARERIAPYYAQL